MPAELIRGELFLIPIAGAPRQQQYVLAQLIREELSLIPIAGALRQQQYLLAEPIVKKHQIS